MVKDGGRWAHSILRSANQSTRLASFPLRCGRPLASRPVSTPPDGACSLATNEATHQLLATSGPHLSSLSFVPGARHYLRQEPDAGNPLVRICAGGTKQFVSLPRPRYGEVGKNHQKVWATRPPTFSLLWLEVGEVTMSHSALSENLENTLGHH